MAVDQGHQPGEVLRPAMGVECGAVRPFLDEDKMARVLPVDEKLIAEA